MSGIASQGGSKRTITALRRGKNGDAQLLQNLDSIPTIDGVVESSVGNDRPVQADGCVVFNGAGHELNYGNSLDVDLPFGLPFTISFWLKTADTAGYIISRRQMSGNFEGWWVQTSGDNIYVGMATVWSSNAIAVRSNGVDYTDDAWHYVEINYEPLRTNGSTIVATDIEIWIDGVKNVIGSTLGPMTIGTPPPAPPLIIGRASNTATPLAGSIAGLVMTSNGVTLLDSPMVERSGLDVHDVSGNGNHGTITGATWGTQSNTDYLDQYGYTLDGGVYIPAQINPLLRAPCATFSGASPEQITLPSGFDLSSKQSIRIKANFRCGSGYYYTILSRMSTGGGQRGYILAVHNGVLYFRVCYNSTSDADHCAVRSALASFGDGQDYAIDARYDGSETAAGVTILINNVPISLVITNDTLSTDIGGVSGTIARIGTWNGATGWFNGSIWGVELYGNDVLVGSWPLTDGSGLDIAELVGGANGTAVGMTSEELWAETQTTLVEQPSEPTDAAGNALQYQGRVKYNGQLEGANCATLDGANDFIPITDWEFNDGDRLSFWGIIDSSIADSTLVHIIAGANFANRVYFDGDTMYLTLDGNSYSISYAGDREMWNHWELWRDGTSLKLYLNGVYVGFDTIPLTDMTTPLTRIGAHNAYGTSIVSFKGSMCGFHLGARVYPMAEGAGLTTYDASGNENHSTAEGMTSAELWANTQVRYFRNAAVGFTFPLDNFVATAGSAWGDIFADTPELTGDFEISFKAPALGASKYLYFGIAPSPSGARSATYYNDEMTHAILLRPSGAWWGSENSGTMIGEYLGGTHSATDTLSIKRVGTVISWQKNGTLVHTSATAAPSGAMLGVIMGRHIGATVNEVQVNGYPTTLRNELSADLSSSGVRVPAASATLDALGNALTNPAVAVLNDSEATLNRNPFNARGIVDAGVDDTDSVIYGQALANPEFRRTVGGQKMDRLIIYNEVLTGSDLNRTNSFTRDRG